MHKRILYGAVMIAAVVGLLVLDAWLGWQIDRARRQLPPEGQTPMYALPLALLLLPLLARGAVELIAMAAAAGIDMLRFSGLFGTLTLGTLPFWWQFTGAPLTGGAVLAVLAALLACVFADQMIRRRWRDGFRSASVTLLAVAYLGLGGALMLQMRLEFGVAALAVFLAAVKFTDIGAYFTGKAIGRHKMIPSISPGKSWEGLVGGLAFGAGAATAGCHWLGMLPGGEPLAGIPLPAAAGMGIALGLAGQFADLAESVLKRSAKLKDSGAVVPEFGGVLDILDSPLLAAPFGYALLTLLTR